MGRSRYKIHEKHYPYFITSTVVDGLPLFMDPQIPNRVLDSLSYAQQINKLTLYSYVIMPNHIYMVVEGEKVSVKLRAFKSYTARSIVYYLKEINKSKTLAKLKSGKLDNHKDSEYQVWQEGFHPKQISSQEAMRQKIEYIHQNPEKAGFVDSALHWRYSSALNYQGGEGLIRVTLFSG